jgi:hypothetical protein
MLPAVPYASFFQILERASTNTTGTLGKMLGMCCLGHLALQKQGVLNIFRRG